jgi:acetyl-CoA acetyltransferase
LPAALPRARLVDFEMAAVDIFHEGLLMAPVSAIPRLLARHGLTFDDIALWEIHEAFSAQVLCHIKALHTGRQPRHCQYLLRRRSWHGGAAAAMSGALLLIHPLRWRERMCL